jgi:protein-disulfide isomerase
VIRLPDAPAMVVQYGVYESLNCRKMHQATEKMIGFLLNKVRLVYRHFPLLKVHPHAEAAEAAAVNRLFKTAKPLLIGSIPIAASKPQ